MFSQANKWAHILLMCKKCKNLTIRLSDTELTNPIVRCAFHLNTPSVFSSKLVVFSSKT